MSLVQILGRLHRALRSLPLEFAAAVERVLLLLFLALLSLIRLLLGFLTAPLREREDPHRERCNEIPLHVRRKPDPCLYSQFFLMAQGFSVTWDNPDIWVTLPSGIAVDSHALAPDTDYVVHARIHDASFDPALATEVRCFYRPWTFNTPDRTPVEVNPDGSERVVILHIPPWQSEEATFEWRTPDVPNAHYCIQVECRHPDDKNPNNNLGQENTDVISGAPGQHLSVRAALWNPGGGPRTYRIAVDRYEVPAGELELTVDTRVRRLKVARPFASIHGAMLTRDVARGGVRAERSSGPIVVSHVYRGFDRLQGDNSRGTQPLTDPWVVEVAGSRTVDGMAEVRVEAGRSRDVELTVQIPEIAESGVVYPINFTALNPVGKVAGGVTLKVLVS